MRTSIYNPALSLLLLISALSCAEKQVQTEAVVEKQEEPTFLASIPEGLPIEIVESHVSFVSPPVNANGKLKVSYELNLLNTVKYDFSIKTIEVLSQNNKGELIASLNETEIMERIDRPGNRNGGNFIKSNEFAIVNLELELPQKALLPMELFHKITLQILSKDGSVKDFTVETASFKVPKKTDLVLGLPFNKGKWVYGMESHYATRILTEGQASYAQRFAIDWILLDAENNYVNGPENENENWFAYGQELLAVADAQVVKTGDGIIENTPLADEMAIKLTTKNILGNHVVLDLGNDIHAVYAHLIPGSLKVTKGEMVKKGQVLGLLGNSGNSDCPHLHFHLETKSKMPLGGEGIPYLFEKFNQLATFEGDAYEAAFVDGKVEFEDGNSIQKTNELPVSNGVIIFE